MHAPHLTRSTHPIHPTCTPPPDPTCTPPPYADNCWLQVEGEVVDPPRPLPWPWPTPHTACAPLEPQATCCPARLQIDGEVVDPPRPLPWYPGNLAWHMDFSRGQLRKLPVLQQLHEFMKRENEVGGWGVGVRVRGSGLVVVRG